MEHPEKLIPKIHKASKLPPMSNFERFCLITLCMTALLLAACSPSQKGLHESFANYDLYENTDSLSEVFPTHFLYKNEDGKFARILRAGNYGNGSFSYNRQGVIIQESPENRKSIQEHYLKTFSKDGWQVIQSLDHPEEKLSLVMAESRSHRLLTVILRGESPVRIKIYYKPASSF